MELNKKEQEIFAQRQKRYGAFIRAHENLGLLWTGLIQNYFRIQLPSTIPSHIVLLMMVASKLNRITAEGSVNDENYDDGKIYLELTKNAKKEFEKLAKQMSEKKSRPEESDG